MKANYAITNAIDIKGLYSSYDNNRVLTDISFTLSTGSFVGIMGPNGAGKSTLLKAILGLQPVDEGEILLLDKPLAEMRKHISYVPQRSSVDWDFPISVLEVVLMGRYVHLGWFKRSSAADKEMANEALEQVGLAAFAKRQISELSGGQQQRVFLARALVQNAEIYFLDEPFVGVDAATEQDFVQILKKLQAQGKTVVVVHHDLQTAPEYFSHLIFLNNRLVQAGTTHEVFTRENLEATFGKRTALFEQIEHLKNSKQFPPDDTSRG
ncbi:MAG: metal ABC transporter ATP-binding protein [Cytophagales bacterium]|nr:MAG: metal ABC transporter ATP-binding protein [Cytophagales bacterium]TAF59261.1 MAG: metal ABC transporter ATP-binding protein [Cytophagales bacterium]